MPDKKAKFATSQTRENLMRSFAGECQARARYTIAASIAKKEKQEILYRIFTFTAEQEFAHAKLFLKELEDFNGQTMTVDGTYPVDLGADVIAQLKSAHHNELQEFEQDYATFAKIATQEEFPLVAKLFDQVAKVEKIHADRFGHYASLLENGTLYTSAKPVEWMCLHCGNVVDSTVAPMHCPLCNHPQTYFIRRDENPFY